MRAPDIGASARSHAQIDRLINAASRHVDSVCNRPDGSFVPVSGTFTYDWPTEHHGRAWRLNVDYQPLVSVSALVSGGTTISTDDYFLRPDAGPPYTDIEIDLASSAAFAAGDTFQRAISVTGVRMAAPLDDQVTGVLSDQVASTTGAAIPVDAGTAAEVGVGSFIKVDSERMRVIRRAFTDTAVNLGADLDADLADTGVAVADGTAFAVGEQLIIGTERMLIEEITGNTLIVSRAQGGTAVAAAGTGADIYASRTLIVERGVLGTTAATHTAGSTVTRHQVASQVEAYVIALVMSMLVGESTAYAQDIGPEAGRRQAGSPGLAALRRAVFDRYGIKFRTAAV